MSHAYIAYLRVSTQKQGNSGLGLEAQQASIDGFVRDGDVVVARYVEVESGKKADRPQLTRALDHCRRIGATLLIAKLDRLARDVHLISGLMKSGVPFKAVDMPEASEFLIHITAAVAEQEARQIGARTRAALAAAKTRGVVLGGYRGVPPTEAAQQAATAAAAIVRSQAADSFAASLRPVLAAVMAEGAKSLREVADMLNARGVRTVRGGSWSAVQVMRLIERCDVVSA